MISICPFSPKAKDFIFTDPKDQAFLTIQEGSARSGKTFSFIPKILQLNLYKVDGKKVIVGVTKQTIYNNYLSPLFDIIGGKNYSYNKNTGELILFGVEWLVIGAKDEGSEKYIRGLTIGVLIIDEVILLPESSFTQLLLRMSPEGARAYGSTNPGVPNHWLYEKYDTEAQRASGHVQWLHFTMDDNLSLSEAKKEQYRKMYTGIYFRRFVLGERCQGDGVIFKDCFDASCLYDDEDAKRLNLYSDRREHYIGVDCGVVNQQVYLDCIDDGRVLYIDREWVWDSTDSASQSEGKQLTDSQYADRLQEWMTPNAQVIVDPSAASFKVELTNRSIWHIDADNEVLEGIKLMSSMFALGLLKIHKRCTTTIQQLENYAWDDKAIKRGEEKPKKVADHAVDPVRYICSTKIPAWRLAA